jgi:hypothetical protein
MQKKGLELKNFTTLIKQQRLINESRLVNNLELVKSIPSPERMFKKNYTPIVQYQKL